MQSSALSFFYLLSFIICITWQGCSPAGEAKILQNIKEEYKAEEVNQHDVKEIVSGKKVIIAEIIIINSTLLENNSTDFIYGMEIAKKFYQALKNPEEYQGIRIIISRSGTSSEDIRFTREYYYDKKSLHLF